MSKIEWRTELGPVEKGFDDLWLGAKNQSSWDIAGSPRNNFRASVVKEFHAGRALNGRWSHLGILISIKLRMV